MEGVMSQLKKPPTETEYRYVSWLDSHYWEHGKFPAPQIAADALKLSIERIRKLNKSPTVKQMCKNRGIEIKVVDIDSLKPDQIAAANTYLNLADDRPITQKLHELGISPTRFWGWMKGEVFRAYLTERAEELFRDGLPFAHRELLAKVMRGDLKAIRLFYEISGRYTGLQSLEAQNVQILMQRLIEAIQIEVTDQEIIQRIAERFHAISMGEPPISSKVLPVKVESKFDNFEETPISVKRHSVEDKLDGTV